MLCKSDKSIRSKQLKPIYRSAQAVVESLEQRAMLSVTTNAYSLAGSGSSSPTAINPTQLRHAYGFDSISFGSANGTGETIAIVDAYTDPDITSDLATFDEYYGIAAPPSLSVVNQSGGAPSFLHDAPLTAGVFGWAGEQALDVEWAHTLAPGANILLVEADDTSSLDTAVNYARSVSAVSVISMSYAGNEYSGEISSDALYTTPSGHQGITFLSTTGDQQAGYTNVQYQATSPNVIAVGGTQFSSSLDAVGDYPSETTWSSTGGGTSAYENIPVYQATATASTKRVVPDVAFDAGSAVSVCDAYDFGGTTPWIPVVGTSLSTPSWAALIAAANQGRAANGLGTLDGPNEALPLIYAMPQGDFHDIASGSNGYYSATTGFDEVSGRGTPNANLVANYLATTVVATGTNSADTISVSVGAGSVVQITTNSTTRSYSSHVSGVVIYGAGGNDTISIPSSFTLPATVWGGDGNDSIVGGAGNDSLCGQAGDDTIYGGSGNDTLYGGDGNDFLDDQAGNDYDDGQDGNDTYYADSSASFGADHYYDTVGTNTVYYCARTNGVHVTLDHTANDGESGEGDNVDVTGSVVIVGGSGADVLDASLATFQVTLQGQAGNDTLTGGGYNDSLDGGDGNDYMGGGAGYDVLTGDAGNDTIYGGDGNDTLTGSAGSDYLDGQAGDDTLYSIGDGSVDTDVGEGGNDTAHLDTTDLTPSNDIETKLHS